MSAKVTTPATVKPDLRERRRVRTMQSIRNAAITLVVEHGLDNVTAEMIAENAGISLRTFFNYFTYKEETLIPPPLGFSAGTAKTFVSGSGPILDDLVDLLEEQLVELEPRRENIRAIMGMSCSHPRLQSVRERTFRQFEAEFCALFGQRLNLPPEHPTPMLMAAVVSASFRAAMHRWVEHDNSSMITELRKTFSQLPTLFDEN